MSAVNDVLARLAGVKSCGANRWKAQCPAHEDRSPSLSIRETETGQILLYCFAACPTTDVVAAIGLELADLWPEKLAHHLAGQKPNHWHAAREALKALRLEVLVVAIAASDCAAGKTLSESDRARLTEAVVRIRAAAEAVA